MKGDEPTRYAIVLEKSYAYHSQEIDDALVLGALLSNGCGGEAASCSSTNAEWYGPFSESSFKDATNWIGKVRIG